MTSAAVLKQTVTHCATIVMAHSNAEAIGLALEEIQTKCPTSEGWSGHTSTVGKEISRENLVCLTAFARTKDEIAAEAG